MALRALVDQRDLQGNILCGYGNAFAYALYAVVRVGDGAEGRRWLGELAAEVTNAVPWGRGDKPPHTLNVALTHGGLRALGVPETVLATFPEEFRSGMAARACQLGDTGPSAPRRWEAGLRAWEPHVLVTLTAQDAEVLARRRRRLRERVARSGKALSLVHEQESALLDHPGEEQYGREHFGFADGFAQPQVADRKAGPNVRRGQGTPARLGRWSDLAPGEFVLGYKDEDGVVPAAPAEPLGRSGSFMVVRKLRQDVALFTRFLRRAAGGDPHREELLAAKMLGRWRDGTPLVLSADAPDPEFAPGGKRSAQINDFRYGPDGGGRACPLGAHIRRANPRDALGWGGRLTQRHRIIRRGMPYGPRPADPAVDDGRDRGLVFVCYQASIARQFEVIQSRWLNDGDAFGLGSDKDFLLANEDPEGKMTIQGEPPTFLCPQPSFVTTRGGGYFFVPGLAALEALSAGI